MKYVTLKISMLSTALLATSFANAATASFIQKTTDAKGNPVYQYNYICANSVKGKIFVKAATDSAAQAQAQQQSLVVCEEQSLLPVGAPNSKSGK